MTTAHDVAARVGTGTGAVRLGPGYRRDALRRLREEQFDVLVVGGGVTGTGAALDAVTRGLSVALVEQRDFASGTSSRSSKLFHGGLRYLEQFEFPLVFEALKERGLMLTKLCPHLAKPVPFIYPLEHRVWERFYVGSGILLYDLMGGATNVPRHRHLTRRRMLELFPSLHPQKYVGGIRYYDGQVDDARHTMEIGRTAAHYGAAVTTSTRVLGFLREGDRVTGAQVRDLEGGEDIDVRARHVVNCAGVWTDDIQDLVGGRGRFHVKASKGIHVLVPRDRIHGDVGLITRTEKSVLFVIPWGRHWIIGTTDTDWDLDKAHPAASSADIDYVLDHVNSVISQPIGRNDVEGVYAGLRPLLTGESDSTSQLSREHGVETPVAGMSLIAGGKYTTYRVMAKDVVDAAVRGFDRRVPESVTEDVPLLGAVGYRALWNQRHRLADESGLHVARIEHLLNRYGGLVGDVLALIAERPDLAEPLEGADDYLRAEVVYSTQAEGALHLEDVLTRRTRASIESWDRGTACAEDVARLMGEVLDWDEDTVKREVEHYTARVEAERDSQRQPDDATADAARMGAPDVRLGAVGTAA